MFLPNIPSILFLIALAPVSNAQIVVHHRPTSRIIAGCIVGGVFAILFALIICVFAARARKRNNTQLNSKPLFGGPWGRSNNVAPVAPVTYAGAGQPAGYQPSGYQPSGYYQNQNPIFATTNQLSGYHNQQPRPVTTTDQPSGYHIQQASDPVNAQSSYPQYNTSNAQAGPPAYGQEADYEKTYSPPAGPPPVATQGNASCTSPVAPPPVAHISGEDNTFVGGFHVPRSQVSPIPT